MTRYETLITRLESTLPSVNPEELRQLMRSASPPLVVDQKVSGVQIIKDPDLMTVQMLAQRWHCSASRLQRWRTANTGPTYVKIGGKVLYRQEDVRAYEAAHLVKTEPKT